MRHLTDFATCPCGEFYRDTLRPASADADGGHVCRNCADSHHRRGRCAICSIVAPIEQHHVAGKKHSPITLQVCLNCHAILSQRQYRFHQSWRIESRPVLFTIQGVLDVVMLWLERSPVAEQCLDLWRMIGQAALSLVPALRPEELVALNDFCTEVPR